MGVRESEERGKTGSCQVAWEEQVAPAACSSLRRHSCLFGKALGSMCPFCRAAYERRDSGQKGDRLEGGTLLLGSLKADLDITGHWFIPPSLQGGSPELRDFILLSQKTLLY